LVERHGKALYQLTCERNLEGIVCKQRSGLYDTRKPMWVKVKNPNYTQVVGRVELFEGMRP
jgi:ATP-dependent DNA ligase